MISVIGVGPGSPDYLTPIARDKVSASEILFASRRLHDLFPGYTAERVVIEGDIENAVSRLHRESDRRVAVLVSGDPGLFSLLNMIKKAVPPNSLEVVPGISAAQLLFARLGLSWDKVKFISLHGRKNEAERLLAAAATWDRLLVYGGPNFPPALLAQTLIAAGYRARASIGQDLSYKTERLLTLSLEEMTTTELSGSSTIYLELKKESAGKEVGKLYGIGVGPGDPELITIKAAKIIRGSRIVYLPQSSDKTDSLAKRIAANLISDEATVKELIFPMTNDGRRLERYWRLAAEEISTSLMNGADVAFLTLGDPTIYSTFVYLTRAVQNINDKVEVEIIPGISSPFACAAAAGISLAEGREKIAIIPVPDEIRTLDNIVNIFDAIILLKVGKKLDSLIDYLEKKDLASKAVLVKSVGLPEETIIDKIKEVKKDNSKIGYFSTVIIKNRNR